MTEVCQWIHERRAFLPRTCLTWQYINPDIRILVGYKGVKIELIVMVFFQDGLTFGDFEEVASGLDVLDGLAVTVSALPNI